MATSRSHILSEDQFLCCICLDVLTDPVTIPCGHNFCKTCITQYWNSKVLIQCPMCKRDFHSRPELHVNTFISEITAQFLQQRVVSSSGEEQAKSGDVPCDVCPGAKLKAVKSCLQCLTSYCETHLEPHHRTAGLKRHKLMEPVRNLEERICQKHERPLEMFCRTDEVCICQFCTEGDHKGHRLITLQEEYKDKQAEVQRIDEDVQKRIQERLLNVMTARRAVTLSKEDVDRQVNASFQVFTALTRSVNTSLAQLIGTIKETQTTREKEFEGFVRELEEEIFELTKRSSELEQLSLNKDHIHFLRSFSSLSPEPSTKDWTNVELCSSQHGNMGKIVSQLEQQLTKEVKELRSKIELKWAQQFAVNVTLDPETADPHLLVSDDRKQVSHGTSMQNVPDSPKRFSTGCVFGQQSFSSGRHYYEVQVKEKTDWTLGVAGKSVNRKEYFTLSPKNGHWTVCLMNGNQYKALTGPSISLTVKSQPQRVGVLVCFEEGVVSFYDVDAATTIHCFTGCQFTEKLYPYFNPCHYDGGINSKPLVICPVNDTDSNNY